MLLVHALCHAISVKLQCGHIKSTRYVVKAHKFPETATPFGQTTSLLNLLSNHRGGESSGLIKILKMFNNINIALYRKSFHYRIDILQLKLY